LSVSGWFVKCTSAIQRRQAEAVAREDQDKKGARKKCKLELVSELKELEASNVGANPSEFLKFLYTKFPPKKVTHTLDESKLTERADQKKILMVAIIHYHPDKQDEEKHGLKWIVLCNEITKALNARYEQFKCE